MATKRLGDLLVQRGWITREQLSRALKSQQLLGGRLGTCLLEMDVISEDLLLMALSEHLGVPTASGDDLRGIPQEVYELVPAKLARRCQAIPFRLVGRQLDLALLDVGNLACQDELAFASGKKLSPHVALEVRVLEALETYYGEECPSRIVHLLDRLNRTRYLWERPEPAEEVAAPREELLTVGKVDWDTELPDLPPPKSSPPPPSPPPAAPVPVQPPPKAPSTAAQEMAAPETQKARTLEGAEARIRAATAPDEVARALLAYLGPSFQRMALFTVRRGKASGWMGQGPGVDEKALKDYTVDLRQPSLFLNLDRGSGFHLGPLPQMPAHQQLAKIWGGTLPESCLMLPIRIGERLVAVLYADRQGKSLAGLDLGTLQRLAAEAGDVLGTFIRKRKNKKGPPAGS